MGGALSLYAACTNPKNVAACVVYYGGHPKVEFDFDGLAAPVLGQWAEDDDFANPNIARFEAELGKRDKLKLISKREQHSHNSWLHNHPRFVAGKRSTNYLYMNPEDGGRVGVESGAMVEVRSRVASVRLPVQLTDEMMVGAVALPHGWGHQDADGLSVASQTRGANVNLLAADGPDELEYFSGMAKLNGIWVEVLPV